MAYAQWKKCDGICRTLLLNSEYQSTLTRFRFLRTLKRSKALMKTESFENASVFLYGQDSKTFENGDVTSVTRYRFQSKSEH